jgi:hypothetical protein
MAETDGDEVFQAVVAIADESLDHLRKILSQMSYEQANTVPTLPGANSPYAIVTHCIGMTDYWGGSVIAGLRIPRDRDAEFEAHGDPQLLCEEVERLRRRFPERVRIALTEGVRDRSATGSTRSDAQTASPTWILLHIVRELAQHLGQLELTRDVIATNDR